MAKLHATLYTLQIFAIKEQNKSMSVSVLCDQLTENNTGQMDFGKLLVLCRSGAQNSTDSQQFSLPRKEGLHHSKMQGSYSLYRS